MKGDDCDASDTSKQAHAVQAHVPATRADQKNGIAKKAEKKEKKRKLRPKRVTQNMERCEKVP